MPLNKEDYQAGAQHCETPRIVWDLGNIVDSVSRRNDGSLFADKQCASRGCLISICSMQLLMVANQYGYPQSFEQFKANFKSTKFPVDIKCASPKLHAFVSQFF